MNHIFISMLFVFTHVEKNFYNMAFLIYVNKRKDIFKLLVFLLVCIITLLNFALS